MTAEEELPSTLGSAARARLAAFSRAHDPFIGSGVPEIAERDGRLCAAGTGSPACMVSAGSVPVGPGR